MGQKDNNMKLKKTSVDRVSRFGAGQGRRRLRLFRTSQAPVRPRPHHLLKFLNVYLYKILVGSCLMHGGTAGDHRPGTDVTPVPAPDFSSAGLSASLDARGPDLKVESLGPGRVTDVGSPGGSRRRGLSWTKGLRDLSKGRPTQPPGPVPSSAPPLLPPLQLAPVNPRRPSQSDSFSGAFPCAGEIFIYEEADSTGKRGEPIDMRGLSLQSPTLKVVLQRNTCLFTFRLI